ncbi:hypothetical protein CBR_g40401 [Chara braunii]|uniref:Reverse transcriptase domain-containing protein n=1 Tax=Chara braunii TaxID=69332 RepID=A0A388LTT5_CHABU|nr:hypothetical protein CBR_g40401 [Chara braunii]|eukprot:GBG85669.1 hypothetical protein CBR_g40401 [Chara braunii]
MRGVKEDLIRAYEDGWLARRLFNPEVQRGRVTFDGVNVVSYVAKAPEVAAWMVQMASTKLNLRGVNYPVVFKPWMTKIDLKDLRLKEAETNFWIVALRVPFEVFYYLASAMEGLVGGVKHMHPPEVDRSRPKLVNVKFDMESQARYRVEDTLAVESPKGKIWRMEVATPNTDWCRALGERGKGFFRLNSQNLEDPGLKVWVRDNMETWNSAKDQFQTTADWLDGGLARVSGMMSVCSRILARDRNREEDQCRKAVEEAERKMMQHPISERTWAAERARRLGEWEKIQAAKHGRWEETLKIKGIVVHDKLTKKTFRRLLPSAAHQQVVQLNHPFDPAAAPAAAPAEMLEYARLYYADILTARRLADSPLSDLSQGSDMWQQTEVLLTPQERLSLDRPITLEELAQTLRVMATGKAPGRNGLSVEFFRCCWDALGPPLVEVYNKVLVGECLGAAMTHGVIALMFKKGDKTNVRNYRPIFLLNVDYKILAKTMALRLGKILPRLVERDQGAFVQGRSIFHNILTTIESVEVLKGEHRDMAVLMLDLEKAYDRVGWSFVLTTLRRMGFGDGFCRWVLAMYTAASFAVQVNGHLSRSFQLTRSLRQGCLLAPLLFVLQLEVPLNCIRKHQLIKGLPLAEGRECRAKALADNLFLVPENSVASLGAIKAVLEEDAEKQFNLDFVHLFTNTSRFRVEEVGSELKHANDQLAKMKDELARCTKDLEGAKTQRYYLVSATNDATSAKSALDKDLEVVKKAVEEKSRGLESSEAALLRSTAQNRKLQAEVDRLRREVDSTAKRFEATLETLESTRQAKEEAYQLAEEYKRMLTEEMDSQMRGDEERTLRWEAALENANRQYREAVEKIHSQQRLLEDAREELRVAREEAAAVQKELDTLKEQHKVAVEGVAKLRQVLKGVKQQQKEASEGASNLRVDLIEAREDASLAEKRARNLQAEIEKLREEVRGAEERERKLQREMEEVRKVKTAATKGEGGGRKQVVDELEAKLELAQQAKADSEARAERAETDARIARVAEARAKAMAGAAESRMKATLQESEMRLAAAIEEAESRVASAQREVVACRQSEAKAVATLEAMRKETMEERKKYQTATAEAEEVSALAKMAKEEMEITTLRSREAEQRAEARVREMKTRSQAAESQVRALKEELKLLQGQLRGLKMQFDTVSRRAEEEATRAKDANEEVASLQQQMQELQVREREAAEKAERAETEKLVVEGQLRMFKAEAESRRKGTLNTKCVRDSAGDTPSDSSFTGSTRSKHRHRATYKSERDNACDDTPSDNSFSGSIRSKHRQGVHHASSEDGVSIGSPSGDFKLTEEKLRRTSRALTRVVSHQPRYGGADGLGSNPDWYNQSLFVDYRCFYILVFLHYTADEARSSSLPSLFELRGWGFVLAQEEGGGGVGVFGSRTPCSGHAEEEGGGGGRCFREQDAVLCTCRGGGASYRQIDFCLHIF